MQRLMLACTFLSLLSIANGGAQVPSDKGANPTDDSEVKPPVTKADVKIVQRAREIFERPPNF